MDLINNRYSSQYRWENKFEEHAGSYKGYELSIKFDGDDSEMAKFLRGLPGSSLKKTPQWIASAFKKGYGFFAQTYGKTKDEAIKNIKNHLDKLAKESKDEWKDIEKTKPKTKPMPGYEWRFGDSGWTQLKK